MAKITIETDAELTIKQMQDNLAEFKKLLSLQVFRALTVVEAAIKKQLRGPSGLKRRTGRLFNTWGENKKVIETGTSVEGELSSAGVPYAAIHEYGGVIKPVNSENLAIPLPGNRRADGSPKVTLQQLFGSMKAQVFTTKNGVVMLSNGKKSKTAKLTPMYVFKKSVTIPARPYIRPALAATQETILKNFGVFISATFGKKGS
jgi:phage gpG-like protein